MKGSKSLPCHFKVHRDYFCLIIYESKSNQFFFKAEFKWIFYFLKGALYRFWEEQNRILEKCTVIKFLKD